MENYLPNLNELIENDFYEFFPLRKSIVKRHYEKYKDWFEYDDFVQTVDLYFLLKAREYYTSLPKKPFKEGFYKNQYKWNFPIFVKQEENYLDCNDVDVYKLFYGEIEYDETGQPINPGIHIIKINDDQEKEEKPPKKIKRFDQILLGIVLQAAYIRHLITEEEKEIALLFLVDNKTQKEIAQNLRKSLDHVKKKTSKFKNLKVNYKEEILNIPSAEKIGIPSSLPKVADSILNEVKEWDEFDRNRIKIPKHFFKRYYYFKRFKLRETLLIAIFANLLDNSKFKELWQIIKELIINNHFFFGGSHSLFKELYQYLERNNQLLFFSPCGSYIKILLKKTQNYRIDIHHTLNYYEALLKDWIKQWETFYCYDDDEKDDQWGKFLKLYYDGPPIYLEKPPTHNMGETMLLKMFLHSRRISNILG